MALGMTRKRSVPCQGNVATGEDPTGQEVKGEEEPWRRGPPRSQTGGPASGGEHHFRGDSFGLGEKERKESDVEGNSKENICYVSALEGARSPGKKRRGEEQG